LTHTGTTPMARVAVVGCSGSGKTRLAAALADALVVPHVELDSIYHQPGWTPLSDDEFRARVTQATEGERWVVDGNYSVIQDIVWDRADTVVWFDLPYAVVLVRTVRRTLRRTVTREELWNGNREPLSNLWSWNPERSIIAWTATRHGVYRCRYGDAERDPRWRHLRFVRLRAQAEADELVRSVRSSDQTALTDRTAPTDREV
jgi:adenylate kinase family enzyme